MSRLSQFTRITLQRNAPLAKYTAARLGGNAEWLYVSQPDDSVETLARLVQTAWDDGLPVRVLGGGANVLVSDAGVRGLVVVNRITDIRFGDWHEGRNVSVSAGTGLLRLVRECAARGLSGMEWAVGVPGSVGGAIINNAGAHGSDMAASLADVVVLDREQGAQLLTNADLHYAYRYSVLKERNDRDFLVLLATLCLQHADSAAILERMAEYNAYRKRTQPPGASLGSIFKNPPGDYAGRLIEAAGLKGVRIGGVEVSHKHANFFINTGEATATDYYALIRHVQDTVQMQFGIALELEIELVGAWDT